MDAVVDSSKGHGTRLGGRCRLAGFPIPLGYLIDLVSQSWGRARNIIHAQGNL